MVLVKCDVVIGVCSCTHIQDFGAQAMAMTREAHGHREMDGSRTRTTTRNSIGATCSSAACSLQHKFESFGTVAAASGNSSAQAAAAASATATATATTIVAAAAVTATATAAATAATTSTNNYVNPVATSMSTAMCSPATAALQKLFNCSVGAGNGNGVGGGGVCQNVSHRNQQQQIHNQSSHSSSNNNCPVGSHNNGCLSATGSHGGAAATGGATGSGTGASLAAGALPLLGAVANRKKCTNVKSTLIAKKTKFLKFLEEEKWRSSTQAEVNLGAALSPGRYVLVPRFLQRTRPQLINSHKCYKAYCGAKIAGNFLWGPQVYWANGMLQES